MMNERIFLCISFVTNRERFYFISFSLFFLFCFVFLDCHDRHEVFDSYICSVTLVLLDICFCLIAR